MSEAIGNKVYIIYGEAWHAAHKIQKNSKACEKNWHERSGGSGCSNRPALDSRFSSSLVSMHYMWNSNSAMHTFNFLKAY